MSVASLKYRLAARPATPIFTDAIRGIWIDDEDRLYAVGDSALKVFRPGGELLTEWKTRQPPHCVAVDGRGAVWVGEPRRVEVFDPRGTLLETRRDPQRINLVTAIGFAAEDAFFGDAVARCINRYDSQGAFVNAIGDEHRKGGFHIPNGVVDFAIDAEGVVHVANPGMHRVERHSVAGELLGRFGRFDGRDPAGFPGCCNPTNLTVDGRGRVVVTEKAGPRAKVYDPTGELLTVVASDVFDPSAKNMDVAVDSLGRIYVADTARLGIRVFEPIAAGVPA